MKTQHVIALTVALLMIVSLAHGQETESTGAFERPVPDVMSNLFVQTDTCNVYVLRDGEAAILIGLGDGSVLDQLHELGVERVEWVLFTEHHREQNQGMPHVDRGTTRVAAPEAERALFEQPGEFREWDPKLGDKYTVHGSSYVRPPSRPIPVDRTLEDGGTFRWRDYRVRCLNTPGHSPGGMTYIIEHEGRRLAFTGGLMHDGARMTTWFDTEWDYGFGKGIDTLIKSVKKLRGKSIDVALPSQGPVIRNTAEQLGRYVKKLGRFRKDYLRGYPVRELPERRRDPISTPTEIDRVNQVSEHLYKLTHKMTGKNFAIIISDSGHGLIVDSGLFSEELLHNVISGLKKHRGLKQIDAMWISHYHGDHFLHGRVLREEYGAEVWTLDRIVDKVENPRRYDYPALISAYGTGLDGLKVDKTFSDGDTVNWQGYELKVDWMPGQTEFGCSLRGELDGQQVIFTGDNIFGDPADETQDGHECVVARNSAIIEEGYLYAARYLKQHNPDLLMGGHSFVMPDPGDFIDRYHAWSKRMIQKYRNLLPDRDYEYFFDPYWVSAYPYRVDLSESGERDVRITVRNFRRVPQHHRIELALPKGVHAEPAVIEGLIKPESRRTYTVHLSVNRDNVSRGVQIVPFDITLDGKRYGQLFDFLIRTSE